MKRDGRLVEEVYRVGGRYGAQIAAIVAPPARRRCRSRLRRCRGARSARPKFYRTGEDADRGGVRHRLGRGPRLAGRHDQRLRRGLPGRARREGRVGSARLLREPREDREPSERSRARRSGSKTACRGIPQLRKPGVDRHHAPRAIDVVIETGDAGPMTPIGINLPNDQRIREKHGSKSVSLSNVARRTRSRRCPRFAQRVLLDARGSRRAPERGARWPAS